VKVVQRIPVKIVFAQAEHLDRLRPGLSVVVDVRVK
jgi:multidrug resistance efflux pump